MTVQSLKPGTFINHVDFGKRRVKEMDERISVTLPARAHLSVLDMNRFAPGYPGGGGVGVAVNKYLELDIKLSHRTKINGLRPSIIEHTLKIISDVLGYEEGFQVNVKEHGLLHKGLGSTSALMSSVAFGSNYLLGQPLDLRELRLLVGLNFVEEADKGLVRPGYETGVGPMAGFYGGLVIMADGLEILHRMPLKGLRGIAIIPKDDADNAGESEVDLLSKKASELDARDGDQKSYEVLFSLFPGAIKGNVHAVGDSIWNLQKLGSKTAEVKHHTHSDEIYSTMEFLRNHGGVITGMSSVGPTILSLFCDEFDLNNLETTVKKILPIEEIMPIAVDNNGVVVKILD